MEIRNGTCLIKLCHQYSKLSMLINVCSFFFRSQRKVILSFLILPKWTRLHTVRRTMESLLSHKSLTGSVLATSLLIICVYRQKYFNFVVCLILSFFSSFAALVASLIMKTTEIHLKTGDN